MVLINIKALYFQTDIEKLMYLITKELDQDKRATGDFELINTGKGLYLYRIQDLYIPGANELIKGRSELSTHTGQMEYIRRLRKGRTELSDSLEQAPTEEVLKYSKAVLGDTDMRLTIMKKGQKVSLTVYGSSALLKDIEFDSGDVGFRKIVLPAGGHNQWKLQNAFAQYVIADTKR